MFNSGKKQNLVNGQKKCWGGFLESGSYSAYLRATALTGKHDHGSTLGNLQS